MRDVHDGLVRVRYPDYIFCFNRCSMLIDSPNNTFTVREAQITVSEGMKQKYGYWKAYNGEINADIRKLLQAFFNEDEFFDATQGTCKKLHIRIDVSNLPFDEDEEEGDLDTLEFDTLVYWGALRPYEVFNPYKERTVKCWEGYPFTVDITPDKIDIDISEAQLRVGGDVSVPIDEERKMMRLPYDYGNSRRIFLTLIEGGTIYRYDLVRVEYIGCEAKGVYLRWIDRYGRLCYYLFKKGVRKDKTSVYGSVIRDNTTDAIRRMGYDREISVALCAPLVDVEMMNEIEDVVTSPLVDMYEDDVWKAVTVKAGTFSRGDAEMQDFVFEIEIQDIEAQRL